MHHSLLQKKRVEQGFREFFKDDEQSGSHDSARLCAVGVPDFTGVEDIFRLTVGQSKMPLTHYDYEFPCVPVVC